MLTSKECLKRYGAPEVGANMMVWKLPVELVKGVIPSKIYCNKDLQPLLEKGLRNVIDRGLIEQIESWDGCFNIRPKKGGKTLSLHSWGVAFDINAVTNPFGKRPAMSKELVQCFTDAGLEWGGNWSKPDGMHFQPKE